MAGNSVYCPRQELCEQRANSRIIDLASVIKQSAQVVKAMEFQMASKSGVRMSCWQ
jgi:hypothetical protein